MKKIKNLLKEREERKKNSAKKPKKKELEEDERMLLLLKIERNSKKYCEIFAESDSDLDLEDPYPELKNDIYDSDINIDDPYPEIAG